MIGHMLDHENKYTYDKCIISFSIHAIQRMKERNISQQEVLELLSLSEWVWIYPSDQDDLIDLCFGCVNFRYLLVAINRVSFNIVTVRQMSRQEIRRYKENKS
jgi:hypothetical protein